MPIFRKDGKNILFIHVPKTGGSTVERVFKDSGYQVRYLDGKVGPNTINHLRRCTPQHMHAELLRLNFRIENFDMTFMIVRDPVSRFKSEYIWRNRIHLRGIKASSVQRWGEKSFNDYALNHFVFDNHLRPQAEFYVPGSTVYRFEKGMPAIIDDLNSRRELSLNPEVPRIREAKTHSDYSSSDVNVSAQLETRIKDFYRQDYDMYEYPL